MNTLKVSREQFLKARQNAREQGYTLTLPVASKEQGSPFVIRVRRLSLDETAATNGISPQMQQEVKKRTTAMVAWQEQIAKRNKDTDVSAVELIEQLTDEHERAALVKAVHAVCLAAFIEPRLVDNDADAATQPDAWHVDDFAFADLYLAFETVTDVEGKAGQRLRLFRPESAPDVAVDGTVQASTAAE